MVEGVYRGRSCRENSNVVGLEAMAAEKIEDVIMVEVLR